MRIIFRFNYFYFQTTIQYILKTIISNNNFSAAFNHKGAELISFKKDETEFIWNGNPEFWDKHSPVLFPIVGTLKNNQYQYNNQTYTLSRHGFARDMEFDLIQKTNKNAVFSLKSSEETLKNYPFEFELQIIYTLENNKLIIQYKVLNNGNENMYFSIGAHPAFSLPDNFENYAVEFGNQQSLECYLLEDNLLSKNTKSIELENGKLQLNYDLFKNDALIFKDFEQKELILTENSKPFLKVNFEGFPDLGIWTKPNAPFLCIEPWFGYSDSLENNGNLSQKEGIQKIDSQSEFNASYSIEII